MDASSRNHTNYIYGVVVLIIIAVLVGFAVVIVISAVPPSKEQIQKYEQDKIDWCYNQKGKAKFSSQNIYLGCEVQK